MKRLYVILLSIAFLLVACDQTVLAPNEVQQKPDHKDVLASKEPVELVFWSYYGGWEPIIEQFQSKYPHVTIKMNQFTFENYVDHYMMAIANGKTPDVMIADSEHFGQFSSIAGLENLSNYGAGKYYNDFSESLWESNKSYDGKTLIGFPSGSSPLVTYYRYDILKENGFPAEPEQLAKFMENPENWLAIARALKEDNSYLVQWPSDVVVQILDTTVTLFDQEMNFARDSDVYKYYVSLSKTIYNEGLHSSTDIWTKAGIQAIQDGKVAMMYMGTWGAKQIEEWAPETAGKWRQTRLPFNLYGWVNSSSFMIPSASQNKDWAYEFIRFSAVDWSKNSVGSGVPPYKPARVLASKMEQRNAFFGGQALYAMNEKLSREMKEFKPTPLDARAKDIWVSTLNQSIESGKETETIILDAELAIWSTMGKEIGILKSYLKKEGLVP